MSYAFTLASEHDPTMTLTFKRSAGWFSERLGYHEGLGPYFSLPEAIRRAEQVVGESAWYPAVVIQVGPVQL